MGLLFLPLLLNTSCALNPLNWSSPPVILDPTAEAIFNQGLAEFEKERYTRALNLFHKVKDEYPFSPQAIEAEVKVGESYYRNGQYPEAIAAFKEFQALHPTHESIPLVTYHLGLAHFEQFKSIDRDQKDTEAAKSYFETVIEKYPASPYAENARKKLAQCMEYLAEHEFYIASFYLREEEYPAAISRLESILRDFPGTRTAVKALYRLGESYRLAKNPLKSRLAFEAMLEHYPEDPLAKEAQAQLAELTREKQDPLALLLAPDGRPPYIPTQPKPDGFQTAGNSDSRNAVNFTAKKEVVHEKPGDEKGLLRRVVDTLNPFSWSSSDNEDNNHKGEESSPKVQTAEKKKESPGFFSSLWQGFKSSGEDGAQADQERDQPVTARVDESLKRRGVDTAPAKPLSSPPTTELPSISAEKEAPPTDPAEVLRKVDANLEGKDVAGLPALPEIAPGLGAPETRATEEKPAPAESETNASATTISLSSGEILSNIDDALKQKGIEPEKLEISVKPPEERSGTEPGEIKKPSKKEIELDPKLAREKGPFFLEGGGYSPEVGENEPDETQKPEKAETVQPSEQAGTSSSQPEESLPESVVKGIPRVVQEKTKEEKPAPEKSAASDTDAKGALDQLQEDLKGLGTILNPFGW